MSLAEPRKRRKNPMHSINLLESNHWINDDSKFGQKMLEKFGWSKGSGLGKNQQGISQNIRVQQKLSSTGVGFVAHNADDWFKAGEEYSRLLSQLAEKVDQPTISSKSNVEIESKKSLVQNSLNSKSRVHYHKFTKGKDLTQYKKQELACILGKGVQVEDNSANSLDMKEYFKNKQKSKMALCHTDPQIINDDEIFSAKTNIDLNTDILEINVPAKKKKRESKLSKEIDIVQSNENDNVEEPKKSQNDKHVTLHIIDSPTKNNEIVSAKTNINLNTDMLEINLVPAKKKKRESKLSKEIDIVPFNENDNVEEPKKSQNDKHVTLHIVDSPTKNNEIVSAKTNIELITDVHETNVIPAKKKKRESKLSKDLDFVLSNESDNVEEPKTKKCKIHINEDVHDEEIPINNKYDVPITKENVEMYKSEYNSYKDKKPLEEHSELVLVQYLIENSSASKKYCRDLDIELNHLFEKKVKKLLDSAKSKTPTQIISTEIRPSNEKPMSDNSKTLDPNDTNFVRDFEEKKSQVLDNLSKRQEKSKYKNKISMFLTKHGDTLFFGSNLNDIKGYGE